MLIIPQSDGHEGTNVMYDMFALIDTCSRRNTNVINGIFTFIGESDC